MEILSQASSHTSTHKYMEQMKSRSYDKMVRNVEHGTMTPLIFSINGGLGRVATVTCIATQQVLLLA